MKLKIITQERVVFDEEVDEIYSVGTDGEFGILKGHIPMMTLLSGLLEQNKVMTSKLLQQWVGFYNSKTKNV